MAYALYVEDADAVGDGFVESYLSLREAQDRAEFDYGGELTWDDTELDWWYGDDEGDLKYVIESYK